MRIANTQMLYKHRPIQSISEFSAIAGGQANQMVANLGPIAWNCLVMMYGAHVQYATLLTGNWIHLDVADVLIMIGVNGILIIGLFELSQFDNGMWIMHYIGAVMAVCILFGSLLQGYSLGGSNLVLPIVFNCIAWPCCVWWLYLSSKKQSLQFEVDLQKFLKDDHTDDEVDEYRLEIRQKVNRHSIKCIFLEGVGIYFTQVALSLYVFRWGNTCEWGCMHWT